MKKLYIFIVGFVLLASCAKAAPAQPSLEISEPSGSEASPPAETRMSQAPLETESEPEPDNSWQIDTPENHNMDAAILQQLHTALDVSSIYAMATARDGVIIDEYYRDGYDETSVFPLHSCSKSFTSALIGIAMEQGYINGVDDLLSDYLPQVSDLDEGKQNITLRHLLTQTSGLEWYEWTAYTNWNEFQSAPDWIEYILDRNLVAEPGTIFNYSTGNTHLLAAALEQAVGMSEWEFAKQNLFDILGMESVTWGTDPQGITDGGNGISMTVRDAMRFGQLYANGGDWNGKQIIPADWWEDSTSAQSAGPGDSIGQYGYQWWVRPLGTAGYDAFYAFGAWGQFIFVVPELNLVTVATSYYPQNSYTPRSYFTDYVLAAVKE